MKSLIVLFFLLLFVNVFSQSQKKEHQNLVNTNKQLSQERDSISKSLNEAFYKIDAIHQNENRILKEIRLYFNDKNELELEAKTIIDKYNKLTKNNVVFKEIDVENEIKTKNILFNNSSKLNNKFNTYKDSCYALKFSRNKFNLDTIKRIKDKNEFLKTINDSLVLELESLKEIKEKILEYDSSYYADFIEYEHFNSLLKIKFEDYIAELKPFNNKLKELYTDFKNNGPNGFPKEYFEIWPYTHMTKVENKNPQKSTSINNYEDPKQSYPVEEPKIEVNPRKEIVNDVVDEPAEFPGGKNELINYLQNNIIYPKDAELKGIQGKIYLKFVVTDKGEITNVKISKGITDCPKCNEEALRVVQKMPNWKPGVINGKYVNSTYTLPISFKLD